MLPMEPASLVMERHMLRKIKRLSEGLAPDAGALPLRAPSPLRFF